MMAPLPLPLFVQHKRDNCQRYPFGLPVK